MPKKSSAKKIKCCETLCDEYLSENSLVFYHYGEITGGICRGCLTGVQRLRVILSIDEKERLTPEDSQVL